MEGDVFLHAVSAVVHGLRDRGQCRVDVRHVLLAASRRGLRRDLGFQGAAQIDDMQHGIQRGELGRVDPQRSVAGMAGDVNPAALPRFDHAVLPQPRHGFADDCAADAELFRQGAFGGQLFAGQHATLVDLGEQALGDRVGQGGRRGKSGKRHGRGLGEKQKGPSRRHRRGPSAIVTRSFSGFA
ncbi:hypothetical protein D3C72_1508430 [compost metagenome]